MLTDSPLRIRFRSLFDSEGGQFLERAVMTIKDGSVHGIEQSDDAWEQYEIDHGDLVALPGLVDAHDHFGIDMGDGESEAQQDPQWRTLKGVKNAKAMLASGITTLRSAGERHGLGLHMRKAIEAGWCVGPTAVLSGTPICSTGGHGWFVGIEADGADAVRAAVRQNVKQGCEMIKMIVTGGVTTPGGTLVRTCFTEAEVHAGIEEAHLAEKRIGLHCYGGEPASWAIAAGVDNIEHGTFLDDNQLSDMAAKEIFLVATTSVMKAASRDEQVAPFMRERFGYVAQHYVELLGRAKAAGVQVAVGCDTHHASLAEEVETLLTSGYTPSQALQAATIVGARSCGRGDAVGSLVPGKAADFVVVDGDPNSDPVHALSNVIAVYKAGEAQPVGGVGG